jgi:lipopolysaccharide export system protein LptA
MIERARAGKAARRTATLLLALAVSGVCGGALAQDKKQPNPFQGFSSDNGKPVDVTSDTLEVYQNEQRAVFIGNVVATQGESVLKTPRLVVFYDNGGQAEAGAGDAGAKDTAAGDPGITESAKDAKAAARTSAPGSTSSIKRLEASGGVVVTSVDQKATGANGVFDMATNTAVLTGDVVLTQGDSVIRGKQLNVDLKTGLAKVIGGTNAIFVPSKNQAAPGGKPKAN